MPVHGTRRVTGRAQGRAEGRDRLADEVDRVARAVHGHPDEIQLLGGVQAVAAMVAFGLGSVALSTLGQPLQQMKSAMGG